MATFSWGLATQAPPVLPATLEPAQLAGERLPRDFALDEDGDLLFEGGDLVLLTGASAIEDDVRSYLRLFRGEWFLDITAGIPYLEQADGTPAITGKGVRLAAARAVLEEGIRQREGIRELTSLELSYDGAARRLDVDFRATSDFGVIAARVELGGP